MNQFEYLILGMRPKQWAKNVLLFAGPDLRRKNNSRGIAIQRLPGFCLFLHNVRFYLSAERY